MQFFSGVIAVSFQYSDASGAMLMSIDCNNNFNVQTNFLPNNVIYHLHCAEKIVVFVKEHGKAFSVVQTVKLVDPENLKILQTLVFEGESDHNYYLKSFGNAQEITVVAISKAFYLVPFVRHKRYSVYKIDISSDSLNIKTVSAIKREKLLEPEQYIYEKGYMLGEELIDQNGTSRKVFGTYKIDSEFVFGNKTACYVKDNQSIDLLSDFSGGFSKGENFTGFYLSSTGKYIRLYTSKKSYIFKAPTTFLELF